MKSSYIIAAGAAIVVIIVVIAIVLLMTPPSDNGQNNGDGAVSTNSVDIRDLAFNPTPITVTVGTTVTWTNNDTVDHTVTSTSGPTSFDSGVIRPGETFSFTFTEAGTYDYHCTLHSSMRGQVFASSGTVY